MSDSTTEDGLVMGEFAWQPIDLERMMPNHLDTSPLWIDALSKPPSE